MRTFLCILGVAVLGACSSSSTSGNGSDGSGDPATSSNGHSCNDTTLHECETYEANDAGALTFECDVPDQTVDSCPTTNVRSTCSYSLADGQGRVITFYEDSSESVDDAKSECQTLGGTYAGS